ncbi:BA14K family protein [Rhizobium sp. L9]|uniref:BA14K family protein n=1 Tax=Rhizobium TaxID=379 RepID=UPI000BE858AB|nr:MULTISPECIES: BA14K family protein [Rhizobium]MBX5131433.1 BA14K family protein [Rhizobium lentis]MBX5137526.1 BA14K family protein [Rhizobium lentis]MBX5149741.1 BA14K family protein [Rhizobium lentis]MBX5175147.1 BA14K family protein [Rhizobium lentis]PDT30942.1 BA14K family protein [Rhizobium sp. L9]
MRKLTVVTLCLIMGAPGITPAQAFPAINPPRIEAQQQIEHVRWRGHGGHWGGGYYGGGYHGHHHHGSDWGWALGGLAVGTIIGGALAQPYYGSYYGSPYGYYGSPYRYYGSPYGYYGSPYRYGGYYGRPYRAYAYGGGSSHVSWCYARYRSYRAYDNTYQPYYGPRRQCVGPY